MMIHTHVHIETRNKTH